MGEEVYPFVRSFHKEHFGELSNNILIGVTDQKKYPHQK